jgi:hypothetical protein
MSQEKTVGSAGASSPPNKDTVFQIWKLDGQVREQLLRGVKTLGGAEVAVAIRSSAFTYIKKYDKELIIKYVDGCAVVTAYAKLAGEEVKAYNVTVHNICSKVDI